MKIAITHKSTEITRLLSNIIIELNDTVYWKCESLDQTLKHQQQDPADLILIQLELDPGRCHEVIQDIMTSSPTTIIVISNCIVINSAAIFKAMSAGALDVFAEPVPGQPETVNDLKLKISNINRLHESLKPKVFSPIIKKLKHAPLIAIGASTGGPAALLTVLQQLPANIPAIIVIIQHMDHQFSKGMADWLNDHCALNISIARNHQAPQTGQVYMAGTNDHLTLTHDGYFQYIPEPVDYPYRPSVNVFFESALAHWPDKLIGVLLTGMGRDGADGLLSLYKRGMETIAQDQNSCAVYGMPKAASELRAVKYQLDIHKIAQQILDSL